MSDFTSEAWSYFIGIISVAGIIGCVALLASQRAWLGRRIDPAAVEDTGHVWDEDLRELNHPVPRWWTWMYLLLCLFALGYLLLFPGLGSYPGTLGYTTADEVRREQQALQDQVRPIYALFDGIAIEHIAADPQAREIGQRLFLNTCAQCHGSDARGGAGFPNLADGDWLYGGSPQDILTSITQGRHGVMPAFGGVLDARRASNIAQYVRSLSGLGHDAARAVLGRDDFMQFCAACHQADARGNKAVGAPNLRDGTWLYGSSEAMIMRAILEGRDNRMPAHEGILTPEQIRLLTAWVWGLSNAPDAAAR